MSILNSVSNLDEAFAILRQFNIDLESISQNKYLENKEDEQETNKEKNNNL